MSKVVYKITYPTGKIYVGKDSIGSARYIGSPDLDIVNADFMTLEGTVKLSIQPPRRWSALSQIDP